MNQYNDSLVNSIRANGCKSATKEENDALYPRVAGGDQAAIKLMIESNVGLVIERVESYIRVYPTVGYLRDDLVAEGLLGLTKAVRRMSNEGMQDNPNPTNYISCYVTKAIGAVIEQEGSASVPAETARQMKGRGEAIPRCVPLNNDKREVDPRVMIELRDIIDACCETAEDRIIVEMREKGYVDKEIAARLDLPHTTVYMLRRDLYRRFLEKSEMKGEV